MTVARLITRARREGIKLYPEGRQIRCRAPRGALTEDLKRAISEHRTELLRLLRREGVTYCCTACERFAFPTLVTCFWCRNRRRADA